MAKTGIFFHPVMGQRNWPVIGNKYQGFPEAFGDLLKEGDVVLLESPEAPQGLLEACHSEDYLKGVKALWYWEGAVRSVGGCVRAAEEVLRGNLKNALVFTVAAGHHASRDFGWGGTYLSCSAPTVHNFRQKGLAQRVAILDTDCHHGDGTRSFFVQDHETLHVCFCHMDYVSPDGTKVDVAIPYGIKDEEYLGKVEEEFCRRAREFRPEIILHNFGHDTCVGDYGNRGLSPAFFPRLAQRIKDLAEEICSGRYIVITHGGARRDIAEEIFPEIARILRS